MKTELPGKVSVAIAEWLDDYEDSSSRVTLDQHQCPQILELASMIGRHRAQEASFPVCLLPLQSPLEAYMYMAMTAYAGLFLMDGEVNWLSCSRPSPHDEPFPRPTSGHLAICCQHVVGPYRLDFLLVAYGTDLAVHRRVAVEVDGHDFHERTKEQARHDRRKDRAIQSAGLRILRFTGSEVYADPLGCAKEAVDSAFGTELTEGLVDF